MHCSRVAALAIAASLLAPGAASAAKRKADLSVTKVSVSGPLVPGRALSAGVTVKNAGKAKAPASQVGFVLSLDARASRDDLTLGRSSTKALASRKSGAGTAVLTAPAQLAGGTYRLIACADAAARLKESNERNNCRASAPIRVTAAPVVEPLPAPRDPEPSVTATPAATATPTATPTRTPTPTPTATATPEPDPEEPDPFPQPPLQPPPDPAAGAPAPAPTGATAIGASTEFLYSGANSIQKQVGADTIEPARVAVLRGRVLGPAGPIAGARVTILDHPEFGYTATRADGRYDLAVNGGEPLTVSVEQEGYATVQRTEDVPWQDYVDVDDVVLTPYSTKVTEIDENADTLQVAAGAPSNDGDGSRTATLLFEPGTDATMRLPDGTTKPLGDLEVRATEYTVGANGERAMPGALPATSAYTYAVEFSVDEAIENRATDVRFTKPVPTYVDNFLGFPAGTIVPAAYYDKGDGRWVPSENGVVIKLLAGGIDLTGDDQPESPAQLDAIGIDAAERAKLAQLYPAGKSLWRVEVRHFTPWDYNWPYGCEARCDPPEQDPPPAPACPECNGKGSVIGIFNQTLGESLPITGTPFRLNYLSSRTRDYRDAFRAEIPLIGADVPASLQRIDLKVTVAGKDFTRSFDAPVQPNETFTFEWDGKDAYGRTVQGAQTASVRVGYVYPAVYLEPDRFQASFAQFGGSPLTTDRTRQELTVWQEWERPLGVLGTGSDALGGWTLDDHHSYDPAARTLHLGDGSRLTSEAIRSEITTVADSAFTRGIAVGPDGSLYIAETEHDAVRRVAPDGTSTVVAGGGDPDDGVGDGLRATKAALVAPSDVAVGPDGTLYIADAGNARIRLVGTNGRISTVAGAGDPDGLGDDGPATAATFDGLRGIALAADGTLYAADSGHHRVRRITPDGRIATAAVLNNPVDVAVGPTGALFIADAGDHLVRAVSPQGAIETVAGNGGSGESGNGGPATAAAIGQPQGIAVAKDGSLYIADRIHHRVRRVSAEGVITAFAGSGADGARGDGGAPLQARLSFPQDVAVGPDGAVYIADAGNARVRRAAPSLPGFTDADFALPSQDGKRVYMFDATGRHLRTVDALSGATPLTFGYDTGGRLIRVTDGDNDATTIERAADGSPQAIVAPGGERTRLTLDGAGRLSVVTNPEDEAAVLAYHGAGDLLASYTEPGGGAHRYTYDADGRLVKDESPDGESKTLVPRRDALGSEVTVSSALGRSSVLRYEVRPDGVQRRIVRMPSGAAQTIEAGMDGVQRTTDPSGTVTTLTLGGDPRWGMRAPFVASEVVTTPAGRRLQVTVTRDAVLRGSDPLKIEELREERRSGNARSTSVTRADVSGFTITETSPEERESTIKLDARGRSVSVRASEATAPMSVEYDAKGGVLHTAQGDRSLDYTYDDKHRVSAETDAAGNVTRFVRDGVGRITELKLPAGRTYAYEYDADGNRTAIVTPKGFRHTMTATPGNKDATYTPPGSATSYHHAYDSDGTRRELTFPSGAKETTATDSAGRPQGTSTDALTYPATGARDRAETLTRTEAGEAQGLSFDFDGQLVTGVGFSGNAAADLTYDYDDRLRQTLERIESGGQTVETQMTYDGDDLLTRQGPFTIAHDGPGGTPSKVTDGALTLDFTYDAQGRLDTKAVSVAGTRRYLLDVGYDSAGRVSSKREAIGAGAPVDTGYAYDGAGQLKTAGAEAYDYDPNGNRTLPAATYDAQDRQQTLGPIALSFDADGFLTKRGPDTFDYAPNGDLLRANAISYGYDAIGRRVWREDASGTTTYLYGSGPEQFLLTAVRAPSGELTKLYYDDAGLLYALQRGASRFYVATDQVGSPRLVLDSSGATVREIAYDAFGRVRSDSGGFDLPIGFAGGLADPATGLVRFGYRDYDTMTGRWTAKDPAFFAGSPYNLYSYAGSEPVGTRDPSGLSVSVCWAGVYGFGGPAPKAISHWWLETSTIKRGMGSTGGLGGLRVGWVDNSDKYQAYANPGEIQCEEQEGVDEECVNRMTTGDLGIYGFLINNCHDAVEDVLDDCRLKLSDPPKWQQPGYEFRGPLWIR